MASIRISPDVEAIAQKVADARGLGSSRAAIEAVFRCYWQQYLNGQSPATEAPQPKAQPIEEMDAMAALSQFD